MPVKAGRLSCKVVRFNPVGGVELQRPLMCAVELSDGKLSTGYADPGNVWNKELNFTISPDPTKHIRVEVLSGENTVDAPRSLLGMGIIELEGMDEEKQTFSVPVVSKIGKHVGTVDITLRWFPSRTPAKQRDTLGRESIDGDIVQQGYKSQCATRNAQSPDSPNALSHLKICPLKT